MRAHEEYEDNIGAYLLGALTELEADAFERHLMGCESCRAEVERLRVAAEALPRTVTPMRPPPELKASLMEIVEGEAAAKQGRRSRRPRLRMPRLLCVRPAFALAGAALLLLLGVGLGVAINGGDEGRTVAAQVDSARLPGTSGSLKVGAGEQGGVLRVQNLPGPPPGRVYQVWLMRGSEVIPGALFVPRVDGTGEAGIPDDLEGYDAVLVTREPRGGARKPSEAPLLRVQLS